MPYSKEQLNYFRMVHIVMTIFSAALRKIFKKEWLSWYGKKWRDRERDGRRFFLEESLVNRRRNRKALKTISKGDSSQFDNSILFYCILNSNSIGTELWYEDRSMYEDVELLREMRNEVCHITPKDEVKDSDFIKFCDEAISCFRRLRLSTRNLKAIAREKNFDTGEVEELKAKLKREKAAKEEYEQYFSNKFSRLQTFSTKFNARSHLDTMRSRGILTEDEVEDIAKQKRRETELATLLDSVVYKGTSAVSAFLNYLSEIDSKIASDFMDFLAPTELNPIIQPSTSDYPKHYKLVMRRFTKDIYQRDWETLNRRSASFLHFFQDLATKLFVKIELAYGFNIQGESEKGMRLLNKVTSDAWKAGDKCPRILVRALTRKSLQCLYEKKYRESRVLAEEANMIVSSMEGPEEHIICQKRIADCILYEVGSVEDKKERLTLLWNNIIELCRSNMEGIPRSSSYLRFVFADKARLHLGFSKNGFSCTNVLHLEEAERCMQRLEEPDLKTNSQDTYTDAFRLICESKIAFDRSKLTNIDEEKMRMKTKALKLYDKAEDICKGAHNQGVLFMLSSLKEYLESEFTKDGCELP